MAACFSHLACAVARGTVSAELLGQPDDDALRATQEAEPVHVLVLRDLADELAAVAARRATTSSMSSTANMMRRMPSALAGASSGSALTAGGVWNLVSSTRPWPSGVRIIVMSARTSVSPTVLSTQGPSTWVSPSSSMPSSAKNALAASRSSTTMRTLSIR